jgi:hypothetical protein
MSDTPLSDMIKLGKMDMPKFMAAFAQAQVGVVITNPPAEYGTIQSTKENPLQVASTEIAPGYRGVLVFADPPSFARNYGEQFNGLTLGAEVFNIVVFNRDIYGIRVNSATSEISAIIDRASIEAMLGIKKRPWWKFGSSS